VDPARNAVTDSVAAPRPCVRRENADSPGSSDGTRVPASSWMGTLAHLYIMPPGCDPPSCVPPWVSEESSHGHIDPPHGMGQEVGVGLGVVVGVGLGVVGV
jgi:hypothetical protein